MMQRLSTIPPEILSVGFSNRDLCTRCGTCVGVCPVDALTTSPEGYPVIREELCISCGLCSRTCPGAAVRFGDLTGQTFGHRRESPGFDGHVRATYVGYATDDRLRAGGAGGGVVTALLWDQLRSGAVDGCIATRMKPGRPWEAEWFIARTFEDLLSSQGSRYMIVPVNAAFTALRAEPGRFAYAALPCQVHGYRRMQAEAPDLAARVSAVVGLFCGGSLEPSVVTELLAARGIRPDDISNFQFRGGEWPGRMQATMKDGTIRPLHYSNYKDGAYNYFTSLYMPIRCQTCIDGSGEFSDVSVSDAWTRDERGEYKFASHSRLLVRTERGEDLVKTAVANGTLHIVDVTADPGYRTHKMQTRRKGSVAPLRVERWKRAGLAAAPVYDRAVSDATPRERAIERLASAALWLGKFKAIRYPLMKFLTSAAAIPLIRLRIALKRRKYARRTRKPA